MEPDEVDRQRPMAAVNIAINKFTEAEPVEHEFLVSHWHQVESIRWLTASQLREDESVEDCARRVSADAVKKALLHPRLLEHAVLYSQWNLNETED